jgi:hypothetical protein
MKVFLSTTATFLLLLLLCPSPSLAQNDTSEDGFVPLLNGKDLTGWVVVNTAPSTWHFDDDGLLICSGKPIGEIRTERMYHNFILEVEWRHMKPKGNAGIFVWADDITARGQPFHRGVEVQVLENAYGNSKGHTTHGDIFPIHGATMTPINGRGGSRAFPTESRSKPSPEWNHYRIECSDGNISLAVNGKAVTQGKDASPRKGYICIESEGGIVHYRNMRLKELPDTPIDREHVAIADRGYRSLYTGVDLEGWKAASGWKSKNWVLGSEKDAHPLVSEEIFSGDVGFLFDVKSAEESSVPIFGIGGDIELEFDRKNAALAKLLQESGKWNRIEGTIRNGKMTVSVNGKQWGDPIDAKSDGPVLLRPIGPCDWANIFVRDLSK